jgi:hypothetical protein
MQMSADEKQRRGTTKNTKEAEPGIATRNPKTERE